MTAHNAAHRTNDAWRARGDLARCWEVAGRRCARVHAAAERATGDREGHGRQAYYENEAEEAEFEVRGLLRTFARGPTAAQWAVAGGAPAPQLNDRSRPRPQGGNGRERLPPLSCT